MKIRLVKTCPRCPEQYDAYIGEEKVGYLRLRHGEFRVECQGAVVLEGSPGGDGCFDDDERTIYLDAACLAILHTLGKGQLATFFEVTE